MTHSTAAIIIIGAEVLSGKVDDANGPFLIHALRAQGIEVVETRCIGDSIPAIAAAVRDLSGSVTHLFTTGGIGPTHDDMTIAGVAAGLGRDVVIDPVLKNVLHQRYGEKLNAARLKMAEVPQGAEVRLSQSGFVPVIQVGNITILPGVPEFMRLCFHEIAGQLSGKPFHTRALFINTSESDIALSLSEVQHDHPEVAIGSYPRFDNAPYRVKVTVDGRDEKTVNDTLLALRDRINAAWIVAEE